MENKIKECLKDVDNKEVENTIKSYGKDKEGNEARAKWGIVIQVADFNMGIFQEKFRMFENVSDAVVEANRIWEASNDYDKGVHNISVNLMAVNADDELFRGEIIFESSMSFKIIEIDEIQELVN